MLKRHRFAFILVTAVALLLLAGAVVTAQVGGTSSCPDIVSQALQAVNNLCTGQGRNSACYGNTLVEAQFTGDQPADLFSSEGDIADLGLFRAIETSPLNDALTEWGVSILSVQANLPGSLPGQNALFMLVGGAQIESAVEPETAFIPADPITVTAAVNDVIHDAADGGAPTVIAVSAGQTMLADAQSEGGLYVRVTVGEQFGWIATGSLTPDPAIAALPVYQPGSSFTPMQAFFLRTGIGSPQCDVAPSALVVQGPQDYTVNITANGANVSLGSSVIFETVSLDEAKSTGKYQGQPGVGGLLRITVIDGKAVITAEDGTVTEIPEGYQSTICLTEPDNLGVDGQTNDQTVTYVCGGWTAPEEIPADFRERFGLVDDFPLNYLLDILTPTPVPPAPVVPTATFTPTPAPTETPWPVIPTDTPVPQNGLQIVADVQLAPAMGGFAGLPRFRGVGEGGYGWFFNLSLEVTNAGANPARNIVIGNVFPEDIGEPYVEELSGEFDYQTNTWTIDELAPGQTAALYGGSLVFLDCGGSISSQLTISAEASEPFPPVFSYSAIVDCRASVTVFVSAWLYPDGGAWNGSAFAGVGAGSQLWSLDLFVEVTNFGPLDASNVVVGNIFPLEVTNIDGWTESGDFDPESNTWTIGDVWVNDYLSLSGDASVWLSCGGSVGSDITVTSDTPLYETLWSYSALADCVPATQWVEPPAADAPEATETPAPEVTDAPEATDSPEATDAPEVTDSPEATVAPEPPPEASAEPEATAPPV